MWMHHLTDWTHLGSVFQSRILLNELEHKKQGVPYVFPYKHPESKYSICSKGESFQFHLHVLSTLEHARMVLKLKAILAKSDLGIANQAASA